MHCLQKVWWKVQFITFNNRIITPNDAISPVTMKGNLCFLDCINYVQSNHSNVKSPVIDYISKFPTICKCLEKWLFIQDHCNVSDILNLEKSCNGIKITNKNKFEWKICVEAKITWKINHKADPKANKSSDLV